MCGSIQLLGIREHGFFYLFFSPSSFYMFKSIRNKRSSSGYRIVSCFFSFNHCGHLLQTAHLKCLARSQPAHYGLQFYKCLPYTSPWCLDCGLSNYICPGGFRWLRWLDRARARQSHRPLKTSTHTHTHTTR